MFYSLKNEIDMFMIDEGLILLAKERFAKKTRKKCTEVMALNVEENEEDRFLLELSDEQLLALKALHEKYGAHEYVHHLDEVFEDMEALKEQTCDEPIVSINLEQSFYRYRFCRHELDEMGRTVTCETLVEMTDEEYCDLLSLCLMDKMMNMNKLRYACHELYQKLMQRIDWTLCDEGNYIGSRPFLVTMDEAKEDVWEIYKVNPYMMNGSPNLGYPFF
jgi:hypothetical protein